MDGVYNLCQITTRLTGSTGQKVALPLRGLCVWGSEKCRIRGVAVWTLLPLIGGRDRVRCSAPSGESRHWM